MPNSVSALNPEYWSGEIQKSLYVENTAVFLANTRFVNLVAGDGDTINNPILSYPATGTYTPGSDISFTPLTASNEQLTIGTWAYQAITIDDTEVKQSKYNMSDRSRERMIRMLNNKIEQAFLAEVTNATHSLDAGNVGGSSGSNIIQNTDNIVQIFTAGHTKLNNVDVPVGNRYAVIGGHTLEQIRLQQAGRQTTLGDTVGANGLVGPQFGWNIVYNNNLPYTAVLSLVTQPTNGDTLTIAGVTITLHATLIASAWADIRTDVDTTRTFIRDLINYGNGTGGTVAGTVGTDFTDVSSENRFLWRKRGLKAVDDASADTLTVTGYGDITVVESLTDTTDTWISARQDAFFMAKGASDLLVQIPPFIEMQRDPDQFAWIIKALLGYGKKTFADGAREMIQVKVNALGTATGNSAWLT